MAWDQIILELRKPSCPYAGVLRPGQRIQCRHPGSAHGLSYVQGDIEGWDQLTPNGLARPASPCRTCPAARLPSDIGVECADVLPGRVRIHAVARDRATVLSAYQGMSASGQEPRLRSVRNLEESPRSRWVDLSTLSTRQWEALREAAAMGYFHSSGGRRQGVEDLAARLRCGRSAAHEHLRKALARLIACFDDDEP